MRRDLMVLLLSALASCALAVDLPGEAAQVRQQTESELTGRRAAIITERTTLAASLQQAAAEAAKARSARTAAETQLHAAEAEATERTTVEAATAASCGKLEESLRTSLPRLRALGATPSDTPIIDRAGVTRTVPVLTLGPRQVALGPDEATRGAVVDGRVVGAPLPPVPPALWPLDVTGHLAQAQPVHGGLGGWLAAGRLFIWPILAVGALGLAIAALRLRALLRSRPDRVLAGAVLSQAREGRFDDARSRLGNDDLAAVLRAGLDRPGDPRPAREAAIEAALIAADARLTRGIGLLALLAGIAPLLGLLGTVTGMIDLFSVLSAQGAGQSRGLSGGISEALVTTQAGMLVAVPLLVCHAILARLAERQRLVLEEAGAGVLGVEPKP